MDSPTGNTDHMVALSNAMELMAERQRIQRRQQQQAERLDDMVALSNAMERTQAKAAGSKALQLLRRSNMTAALVECVPFFTKHLCLLSYLLLFNVNLDSLGSAARDDGPSGVHATTPQSVARKRLGCGDAGRVSVGHVYVVVVVLVVLMM